MVGNLHGYLNIVGNATRSRIRMHNDRIGVRSRMAAATVGDGIMLNCCFLIC